MLRPTNDAATESFKMINLMGPFPAWLLRDVILGLESVGLRWLLLSSRTVDDQLVDSLACNLSATQQSNCFRGSKEIDFPEES
jgi:hypothetical protein